MASMVGIRVTTQKERIRKEGTHFWNDITWTKIEVDIVTPRVLFALFAAVLVLLAGIIGVDSGISGVQTLIRQAERCCSAAAASVNV